VKSPLLATVAGIVLLAGGLSVGALAGRSGDGVPSEQAQRGLKAVDAAIAKEKAADVAIDKGLRSTAIEDLEKSLHQLGTIDDIFEQYPPSDEESVVGYAQSAQIRDTGAIGALRGAAKRTGSKRQKLTDLATLWVNEALVQKNSVRLYFQSHVETSTEPTTTEETTTTTQSSPPSICIDTTNNGSTTTITVHVTAFGQKGAKATITFAGEVAQVTLDANGSASASSTVTRFDTYPINVTITTADGQTITATATETLSSSNDVTTTNCH
jgi:hypothetical protein